MTESMKEALDKLAMVLVMLGASLLIGWMAFLM